MILCIYSKHRNLAQSFSSSFLKFLFPYPKLNKMFLELFNLSSDEAFGYEADIFISAIAFGVTVALWRMTCAWCEMKLPEWEKFPKTLQDRMCVETAVLPIRL